MPGFGTAYHPSYNLYVMYVISLGCTHWSDFIADDMGINYVDFVESMMLHSQLDCGILSFHHDHNCQN